MGMCIIFQNNGKDGFPGGSDGQESACNGRDPGSIPSRPCFRLVWRWGWKQGGCTVRRAGLPCWFLQPLLCFALPAAAHKSSDFPALSSTPVIFSCLSAVASSLRVKWCLVVVVIAVPQVLLVVKSPPAGAGDVRAVGSIPGSGSSPGEGNGDPLQDSCLENPVGRGAWRAAVHGAVSSQTSAAWQ